MYDILQFLIYSYFSFFKEFIVRDFFFKILPSASMSSVTVCYISDTRICWHLSPWIVYSHNI